MATKQRKEYLLLQEINPASLKGANLSNMDLTGADFSGRNTGVVLFRCIVAFLIVGIPPSLIVVVTGHRATEQANLALLLSLACCSMGSLVFINRTLSRAFIEWSFFVALLLTGTLIIRFWNKYLIPPQQYTFLCVWLAALVYLASKVMLKTYRGLWSFGVDLTSTRFDGSNLSGASLSGAKMDYAQLTGVNLTKADVSFSTLKQAELKDAYISSAHFHSAHLIGANLSNLIGEFVDFSFADLSDANMQKAVLKGCLFKRSCLKNTNLEGADLSLTNFDSGNLQGANLRSATLIGAQLKHAHCQGVIWDGATYDNSTVWPTGFNPEQHGAILIG